MLEYWNLDLDKNGLLNYTQMYNVYYVLIWVNTIVVYYDIVVYICKLVRSLPWEEVRLEWRSKWRSKWGDNRLWDTKKRTPLKM